MNIEQEEEENEEAVVATTRRQQGQKSTSTSTSTSISSRSSLKNVPLNERPFMVGVEATIKKDNLLKAKYDLYQCLYVYRKKRQQVQGTLWSILLEPLSNGEDNNKLMALFLWENEKYQRANMMEGNSLGLQIQAYPLLETFPLFSFWVQLSGRVSATSTSNNTNATPTSMATPTPMSMISETRNVRRISDGSTTSLTSTTTSCCCYCRRSLSSTRSIDSSLSQSDSCCHCNVCVTTTTTTRCSSTSDVAIPEEETIVNSDDYTTTTVAAAAVIGGKRRSLDEEVVFIKDEAPVEDAVTAAASLSLSRKKIPKVVVESSTKFNEWNHGNELFVITKWRIPPSKQMMDYVYKHLKYVSKIATSSTCNNNCLQHDVYLINNADDPNVIMEFSIWTSNQNNEESINGSLSSRTTCNTDAHEWFLSLPPVKKIYKGLQEMIISYNKRVSSSSNNGEMNLNNEQLSPCTCTMTYWKQMSSSPSKPISIVPSSMN